MNEPQDPEAAETDQTTNVPAVDLPRLVRRLCAAGAGFGGLALIVLNLSLSCKSRKILTSWVTPVKYIIAWQVSLLAPKFSSIIDIVIDPHIT